MDYTALKLPRGPTKHFAFLRPLAILVVIDSTPTIIIGGNNSKSIQDGVNKRNQNQIVSQSVITTGKNNRTFEKEASLVEAVEAES